MDMIANMGDGSEGEPAVTVIPADPTKVPHPDYCEMGTEIPLAKWHKGENRKQRLTGVATWSPPKQTNGAGGIAASGGPPWPPAPAEPMPTRRELWRQRKRDRRGKLDVGLRRLQKAKLRKV